MQALVNEPFTSLVRFRLYPVYDIIYDIVRCMLRFIYLALAARLRRSAPSRRFLVQRTPPELSRFHLPPVTVLLNLDGDT